jgi:hypothetical protein
MNGDVVNDYTCCKGRDMLYMTQHAINDCTCCKYMTEHVVVTACTCCKGWDMLYIYNGTCCRNCLHML